MVAGVMVQGTHYCFYYMYKVFSARLIIIALNYQIVLVCTIKCIHRARDMSPYFAVHTTQEHNDEPNDHSAKAIQ